MTSTMTEDNLSRAVKQSLRSILVSNPDGSTIRTLCREYFEFEGQHLPYRELGFKCAEEYLNSIPDTLVVYGYGPNAAVTVVSSERSGHVEDLVRQQNKHMRRNCLPKLPSIRRSEPSLRPLGHHPIRSIVRDSIRPKNPPPVRAIEREPRFVRKSHTPESLPASPVSRQNLNLTAVGSITRSNYDGSTFPNNFKIVSNMQTTDTHRAPALPNVEPICSNISTTTSTNRTYTNTLINTAHRESLLNDTEVTDTKSHSNYPSSSSNDRRSSGNYRISVGLQRQLRELIANFPAGLLCVNLVKEFKVKYGRDLPYTQGRYSGIVPLCQDQKDIFRCIKVGKYDYYVFDAHIEIDPEKEQRILSNLNVDDDSSSSSSEEFEDVEIRTKDDSLVKLDWKNSNTLVPAHAMTITDTIPRVFLDNDAAVGDYLDIELGEIYDPSKFYTILRKGGLAELMTELQEHYNVQREVVPEALHEVSLFCIALYGIEYHRAIIVDLLPKIDKYVKVLYMDYGTVGVVSVEHIFYMNKKFSTLPMQAIRTRLYNIQPIVNGPWTLKVKARFRSLVKGRHLCGIIKSFNRANLVMEIYLADFTNVRNIIYINDILVEEGYACYTNEKEQEKLFTKRPFRLDVHFYPLFLEIEMGRVFSDADIQYFAQRSITIDQYMCYQYEIEPELAAYERKRALQLCNDYYFNDVELPEELPPEFIPETNYNNLSCNISIFPESMRDSISQIAVEKNMEPILEDKLWSISVISDEMENVIKKKQSRKSSSKADGTCLGKSLNLSSESPRTEMRTVYMPEDSDSSTSLDGSVQPLPTQLNGPSIQTSPNGLCEVLQDTNISDDNADRLKWNDIREESFKQGVNKLKAYKVGDIEVKPSNPFYFDVLESLNGETNLTSVIEEPPIKLLANECAHENRADCINRLAFDGIGDDNRSGSWNNSDLLSSDSREERPVAALSIRPPPGFGGLTNGHVSTVVFNNQIMPWLNPFMFANTPSGDCNSLTPWLTTFAAMASAATAATYNNSNALVAPQSTPQDFAMPPPHMWPQSMFPPPYPPPYYPPYS